MNTPNKLTLARIFLVPVFMVFAALGGYGTPACSGAMLLAAGIVFSAASFTDYLDGHLARKHNLVTDFGKFADPLADKMLTTAALIYMMADGVCHPVVLAVVLFREFAVAGVRMVAASSGTVIAANVWGKIKTVVQMVTVIVYYTLAAATAWWAPDAIGLVQLVTNSLCWLVAVLTALSGVIYLWQNRSCFMQAK